MTAQQLQKLRDTAPSREDRVDIQNVKIDMSAPVAVRAKHYLTQIKNPYHFRCGELAINVTFSSAGKPLREAIAAYLLAKK